MNDLYLGLMSGTSMDGVDAAILDASSNSFIAGLTQPYSAKTRKLLDAIVDEKKQSLKALSQLNTYIGREFAKAALELINKTTGIAKHAIKAIGSHGQTICHEPCAKIPYTVQLGCPHTIAESTGITVVADFRTRDLVVGGQGAPFAPIYHQAVFRTKELPLAVINIGGIANFSYLENKSKILGYDLGPGNCLMDAWVKKHLGWNFDKNGDFANSGKVIEPLLQDLLQDSYFQKLPPKSIGKEYFSLAWLDSYIKSNYRLADIQKTLLMLTATLIAQAVKQVGKGAKYLLVCGGGTHNQALLKALTQLLPQVIVESTHNHGVHPDFLEALMMAWLAEKTLLNIPLDLSQITGAKRLAILGTIYPPGIDK